MDRTIPKSDVIVGLRSLVFTDKERNKLRNYATPDTPFFFTHQLYFPFLIYEAKIGRRRREEADQ
jgi:hypothetical protein